MKPEDQAAGEPQAADAKAAAVSAPAELPTDLKTDPALLAQLKEAAAQNADPVPQPDTAKTDEAPPASDPETAKTDEADPEGEADASTSPPLDAVRVRSLIETIESTAQPHTIGDLIHRLQQEEQLVIEDLREDGGRIVMRLAAIEAETLDTTHRVLTNWCNAARRALLGAGL